MELRKFQKNSGNIWSTGKKNWTPKTKTACLAGFTEFYSLEQSLRVISAAEKCFFFSL